MFFAACVLSAFLPVLAFISGADLIDSKAVSDCACDGYDHRGCRNCGTFRGNDAHLQA